MSASYGAVADSRLSASDKAKLLSGYKDDFEDEDGFDEAAGRSTTYNILNTLLGVSLFAVPWGYERSGFIGGTAIIVCVCMACYETIRILLVSQGALFDRTGTTMTYPEMVAHTMPEPMPKVVKAATLISCIGGCIGYLIFCGDVCRIIFGWTELTSVLLSCVPLIGLSWLKGFKELEVFSFVNFCTIIVALAYILIDGVLNVPPSAVEGVPLFAPFANTVQFVGPATFTFTVHYMLVSMGGEYTRREASRPGSPLRSPLRANYAASQDSSHVLLKPLAKSFLIAGTVIVIFGASSFVLFDHGELQYDDKAHDVIRPGCEHVVCQNIVMNLSSSLYRTMLGVVLIPMIFVTYTLLMAPAREHVEDALLQCVDDGSPVLKRGVSMAIRTLLVLFTAAIAAVYPYFGSTLGAVGGITDAFQAFILPCIIYTSVTAERGGTPNPWIYRVIIFLGSCLMVTTLKGVWDGMAN